MKVWIRFSSLRICCFARASLRLGLSKKSGRFMAKLSKGDTSTSEIDSDLWSRFEFAVDVVAKSPPQHRSKNQKTSEKKEKKPSPTKED
jgi:hypothetical protein